MHCHQCMYALSIQVTDYHMAKKMTAEAVNGPTRSHGLEPFSWGGWSTAKYEHKGHPEVFDFDFERIGPSAADAACAHPAEEHTAALA